MMKPRRKAIVSDSESDGSEIDNPPSPNPNTGSNSNRTPILKPIQSSASSYFKSNQTVSKTKKKSAKVKSKSHTSPVKCTLSTCLRYRQRNKNKRSPVWKHFKEHDKVIAKCKLCMNPPALLRHSGGTSNLFDHLKRFHKQQYYEIKNKKGNMSKAIPPPPEERTQTAEITQMAEITQTEETQSQEPQRTPRHSIKRYLTNCPDTYEPDDPKKKKIDEKLVRMIAKDYEPFNIVEHTGFADFVEELNPRYVLPSHTHVKDTLMPEYNEKLYEKESNLLSDVDHVALTFDSWTSNATENYLAITAHFIHGDQLKNMVLGVVDVSEMSHTGENLASVIRAMIEKFKLEGKVSFATTDNARNMGTTCEELGVEQIGCFAHTINLVVNDSIGEVALKPKVFKNKDTGKNEIMNERVPVNPMILSLIEKAKRIVAFFHRQPKASRALRREQKNRNLPYTRLIQSVVTRWNSVHKMLKSLNENMDCVTVALSKITQKQDIPTLEADEIAVLPHLIKALEPFDEATTNISSSSYVTISSIIPMTKGLIKQLNSLHKEQMPKEATVFIESLVRNTEKRLLSYEKNEACCISTLLDPRFKTENSFTIEENYLNAKKVLKTKISEITLDNPAAAAAISTESQPRTRYKGILSFLNTSTSTKTTSKIYTPSITSAGKVRDYLDTNFGVSADCDPIDFWLKMKDFPEFRLLSLKYLIAQGSSVASERVFSSAEYTVQDRRNNLKPQRVEMLLHINKNMWIIDS